MIRKKACRVLGHTQQRTLAFALSFAIAVWCNSVAQGLSVPVNCGQPPVHVGDIVTNPSGTGIKGDFTSIVGGPPPTLAAAATACGEDHFNWFQVVTADNHPPNGPGGPGNGLTPPYIDPPIGGYGPPDTQWADNRPWYWDEVVPPGPPFPPGYKPGLQLSANTFPDHLHFEDFPGDPNADAALQFKTWLVSLNADGSLHEFHEGFMWSWTNSQTGGSVTITTVQGQPLTPAQGLALYNQLVPEPSTALMFAFAACIVGCYRRSASHV